MKPNEPIAGLGISKCGEWNWKLEAGSWKFAYYTKNS
ncbi:MAG: hypothetical protein RL699_782 [Bacteroidota bacterium]|jgi:hypothetical protein